MKNLWLICSLWFILQIIFTFVYILNYLNYFSFESTKLSLYCHIIQLSMVGVFYFRFTQIRSPDTLNSVGIQKIYLTPHHYNIHPLLESFHQKDIFCLPFASGCCGKFLQLPGLGARIYTSVGFFLLNQTTGLRSIFASAVLQVASSPIGAEVCIPGKVLSAELYHVPLVSYNTQG